MNDIVSIFSVVLIAVGTVYMLRFTVLPAIILSFAPLLIHDILFSPAPDYILDIAPYVLGLVTFIFTPYLLLLVESNRVKD